MPYNDLPSHRLQTYQTYVKGTASVVSIGLSLRSAYPIDDTLGPALQTAMNALTDHSSDHQSVDPVAGRPAGLD